MATFAPDRQAAAALACFGKPVTLPDGTIVQGIFDAQGQAITSPWSEVGLRVRPSQHPNPVLHLSETVAAALSEGQLLTVAATGYRIAQLDPPRAGLTRIELTLATALADETARWQ